MKRTGMPFRDQQQRFDSAHRACFGSRCFLLAQDYPHYEILAMLPETMVDMEAPRRTTYAREDMVARRNHQDCGAKNRFMGDKPQMGLMLGVEVGQYR
jgi:hypothetical protein